MLKLFLMVFLHTFNTLYDMMKAFPDENSCVSHLEYLRWGSGIVSPFTGRSAVYKCKGHRYKCRLSNRYFSVRTQTIFEGSKIPLTKWFYAIYMISSHKKGMSSHQLSRDLGVTQKTAWFILHRVRRSMADDIFLDKLSGIIEADETFVGGKNKNRHADKKVANSQGRSFKDKTPVFGLLQRDGLLYAKVISNTKASSIQPIIQERVKRGSILVSDEWWAYHGLSKYYDHRVIDHGKKQYVDGENHTNSIEGAWSSLKRMVIGIIIR